MIKVFSFITATFITFFLIFTLNSCAEYTATINENIQQSQAAENAWQSIGKNIWLRTISNPQQTCSVITMHDGDSISISCTKN